MLPSVCAPKCRGAGLQIGLRCMTLRCALDFVPNGKIVLRKGRRCSVIFLVKNGGTKPGSKGSCLKNKGWKTREESGLLGNRRKKQKILN